MKKIIAFVNYSDRKSLETEIYLKSTGLPFESLDVNANLENYARMVKCSGQTLTPCVLVEGIPLDTIDEQSVYKQLDIDPIRIKSNSLSQKDKNTRVEKIYQRAQRKGTLRFF
jgi:hypothetical protein